MDGLEDDEVLFGPLGAVGMVGVAQLLLYVSISSVLAFCVLFAGSYTMSRMKRGVPRAQKDGPQAVPAIGIDLGTTQSCIAYWSPARDRPKIIKVDGRHTMPSVISFDADSNAKWIGKEAEARGASHPRQTVRHIKRLMGVQRETEERVEGGGDGRAARLRRSQEEDAAYRSCRLVSGGPDGRQQLVAVTRKGREKCYSPEDISSRLVHRMKLAAEDYFATASAASSPLPVREAVIAVPAYFNDRQRVATRMAAEMAGLEVLMVLSEPTAAALAYGLTVTGDKSVLVFDFGGGTFDVSLLRLVDGDEAGLGVRVVATGGDCYLGGADVDRRVVELLVRKVADAQGVREELLLKAVMEDCGVLAHLTEAAEEAKISLSRVREVPVQVPASALTKKCVMRVRREEIESACEDLFARCMDTVAEVLQAGGMATEEVNEVVLVGGSTRVPRIREMLSEFFGGKELCTSVDADEAVARGAAVQAALLKGEEAGGLGLERMRHLMLFDLIPLAIGFDEADGSVTNVFPANSAFPAERQMRFLTGEDEQRLMDFHMVEGSSQVARENSSIAVYRFPVYKHKGAKAGERELEVTFRIDANGCLQVQSKTLHMPEESYFGRWLGAAVVVYIGLILGLWLGMQS